MNESSEFEKMEIERRKARLYGVHTRSQSVTTLRVKLMRDEVEKEYDEEFQKKQIRLSEDQVFSNKKTLFEFNSYCFDHKSGSKREDPSQDDKKPNEKGSWYDRLPKLPKLKLKKYNLGKSPAANSLDLTVKRKDGPMDHHAENVFIRLDCLINNFAKTVEMVFLSDILRQVTERNRRVIVNFDDASYSLIHARNEQNLNEFERFKSPEIRKSVEIKKYPEVLKFYEKKAAEKAARIRENKVFQLTEDLLKHSDLIEHETKPKNPVRGSKSSLSSNSASRRGSAYSKSESKAGHRVIQEENEGYNSSNSSWINNLIAKKSDPVPYESELDKRYKLPDLTRLRRDIWNNKNIEHVRAAQTKIIEEVAGQLSKISLKHMRHQFEDLIDEMKAMKENGKEIFERQRESTIRKRIKKPTIRPDFSRSLYNIPIEPVVEE